MGLKAEGAAQAYTILGGIVLLVYGFQRLMAGVNTANIIDLVLGIVVILFVILAFDASGFVNWIVKRSGLLLALFGFFLIIIVSYPGITLDIISWLTSAYTLAGLMILVGGLLILVKN